ncbi:MAG: hypothetical protein V8R40_09070 [Dysosmobacter sp.]
MTAFSAGRRVTDDAPTQELPPPRAPGSLGGDNVQGIGAREGQEDSFALVNAADPGGHGPPGGVCRGGGRDGRHGGRKSHQRGGSGSAFWSCSRHWTETGHPSSAG